MNNRSIIRSTKDLKGEIEPKRVQVKVVSLLQIEQPTLKKSKSEHNHGCQPYNPQKHILSLENRPKHLQFLSTEDKGQPVYKSSKSLKGCLRKDLLQERKNSDLTELECKSSKSIKFDFKKIDVFEYTLGQNRKKKVKGTVYKKVMVVPSVAALSDDGECCQIY